MITGSLNVDAGSSLANLEAMLQTLGVWELIGLWLESFIIGLCMWIMTICIFIIIFGRMIEIYITVSVAPIPLATMANREWGQIGNNYEVIVCAGVSGLSDYGVRCDIRHFSTEHPNGIQRPRCNMADGGLHRFALLCAL